MASGDPRPAALESTLCSMCHLPPWDRGVLTRFRPSIIADTFQHLSSMLGWKLGLCRHLHEDEGAKSMLSSVNSHPHAGVPCRYLATTCCMYAHLNHNSHPTHSASQAWTHTADHQHHELSAPDLSPKEEESSSPATALSRSRTQVGNSKAAAPRQHHCPSFSSC